MDFWLITGSLPEVWLAYLATNRHIHVGMEAWRETCFSLGSHRSDIWKLPSMESEEPCSIAGSIVYTDWQRPPSCFPDSRGFQAYACPQRSPTTPLLVGYKSKTDLSTPRATSQPLSTQRDVMKLLRVKIPCRNGVHFQYQLNCSSG